MLPRLTPTFVALLAGTLVACNQMGTPDAALELTRAAGANAAQGHDVAASRNTAALAGARQLAIDPSRSSLEFAGNTGQFRGGFRKIRGDIVFDTVTERPAKVTLDVETGSLWASPREVVSKYFGDARVLFAVDRFPSAQLVSTGIVPGDGVDQVTSDFTFRGQTRRLSFAAQVDVQAKDIRLSGRVPIELRDFGVPLPDAADIKRDDIILSITVVAARQ